MLHRESSEMKLSRLRPVKNHFLSRLQKDFTSGSLQRLCASAELSAQKVVLASVTMADARGPRLTLATPLFGDSYRHQFARQPSFC